MDPTTSTISRDLPFLVTHWLSSYAAQGTDYDSEKPDAMDIDDSAVKKQAVNKIRNAASELASAFATLGAFGQRRSVCF